MADKRCFICGELLTDDNKSKEHILLNAAGGKLKTYDIMCKSCNAKLGSEPDEALALQLRPLANFLGVKRDNGTTPNVLLQSASGKKYEMRDGGRPVLGEAHIDFDPSTGKTIVEAGTIGQARTALWNFKKAHPECNLDVEEVLKHMTNRTEYIDEPLKFDTKWGGEEAFRSIAKAAMGYFIYKGHDRRHISHLIEYLLGDEKKDIVKIYYPDQQPFTLVEGEVLNLIHIVGNKSAATLFAYVVYLGCFPSIILLSDHYDGEDFTETYAHDVMAHQEVDKIITLNMTIDRFKNYHPHQGNFRENANKMYVHSIRAGQTKQETEERVDIIHSAFTDLPEGARIDDKTIKKLEDGLMKHIKHLLRIKDK